VVDQNKEAREEACREAEVILAQEQGAFEAWRDSLETVPTIKALRTKAEDIRQSEFEKVGFGLVCCSARGSCTCADVCSCLLC